jgi:hypothetical protein
MPDAAPDTITITEQHYEDIRSAAADVLVKVSETSLGARSSQRVAVLRDRLSARGFAEGDLALQDLDHTPWSWFAIPLLFIVPIAAAFGTREPRPGLVAFAVALLFFLALRAAKLGTLGATLKVHCAAASRVGVVVDEALSFGAEVASITWRYDVGEATRGDWAVACVERANARAARLAAALGVRVSGVHAYGEEHVQPAATYTALPAEVAEPAKRRAKFDAASASLGPAPSNTERAGMRVTVTYRVGDDRTEA